MAKSMGVSGFMLASERDSSSKLQSSDLLRMQQYCHLHIISLENRQNQSIRRRNRRTTGFLHQLWCVRISLSLSLSLSRMRTLQKGGNHRQDTRPELRTSGRSRFHRSLPHGSRRFYQKKQGKTKTRHTENANARDNVKTTTRAL